MELAKFVNLVPTTEIEEQPTELTNEQWETKLEKEMKEIYSVRIDEKQKLLHYFEVGKMLHYRPTKYQRQLQQIKKVIHRKIGRKFCERPYVIAKRTFKIFRTEEKLLQLTHEWTSNRIYRMSQQEVNRQIEKIQE
jgi:Txe/YoeB family toxin of Txe-Axe toxin-antitoxin module